jgi:HEAT repeat protein
MMSTARMSGRQYIGYRKEAVTQRAASPLDQTRHVVALARAVTTAVRSWGFYPPDHPAVGAAVERLLAAIADATSTGLIQLAVTPRALLLDGQEIESSDLSVSECAALLHDRDILQIAFVSPPPEPTLRALLGVLTLDRDTRRERGGPAALWAAENDTSILIEQIDYQEILEREIDEGPARRDATWKAIVRNIIGGRQTFTPEEQQRLLEISRDVGAIGELAKDARAPFTMPDGSPLLTTQAAAVLAVYKHVATTVTALEPDRAGEIGGALALSASSLDPALAAEVLRTEESASDPVQVATAIKQSFDDQQVALLLARALAAPGHPTSRLAHVVDTLAPDPERRRRVLKLAERLLGERDFGGKRPMDDIRKSLDELLLKYDESTFVSASYGAAMELAGGRGASLAMRGLPAEMDEWLQTLGHESVRRLSGQLLMDLLRNERVPERAAELANDMARFVEDLVLAGAFGEAVPVIEALAEAAARTPPLAADACRTAIDTVGRSAAFKEAADALGDQTAPEHEDFTRLAMAVGPAAVGALVAALGEGEGGAAERAAAILARLGTAAIPPLAATIDNSSSQVQRAIGWVLGQIGTAAAVPPLQTLLRKDDPRVQRAAVSALARIDCAAATRAIHTALRTFTGDARTAVIEALVGLKDPRVVPLLGQVLETSDPFGADHGLVLEALAALASLRDDRALPQIVALARRRRWLAWRATRRLRAAALAALVRMESAKAKQALDDLGRTGDFFLRRLAASAAVRGFS